MKIRDVRTHVLQAALSQPFAYSRAWYDTRTAMLVEIETDTGLTGWGECYGPAAMTSAVVKSVAPWLIGEDPLRTDFLWQTVYARLRDHGQKGVVIEGLSGIDIALWDIKGKHFGVPAHQLLGGRALAAKCRLMRPGCIGANRAIPGAIWPRRLRATLPRDSGR